MHIISLGGVTGSNSGILELDSLTQLYGDKDVTQRLGYLLFPQRWPRLRFTPRNRARRDIIRYVAMGPMTHTGRNPSPTIPAKAEPR